MCDVYTKKIFGDVRNTSFVDYPKQIAAVVYVGACNLMCSYCHNHELISEEPINNMNDVLVELRKACGDRNFVDGVVISGGEPSLFPEEVSTLIDEIRKINPNILIKVDTNGTNPEFIQSMIDKKVNHIAMDYKTSCYHKLFGIRSRIIGDSLIHLAKFKNHEVRMTMAPDYISETDFMVMVTSMKVVGIENISIQRYSAENAMCPIKENYTDEELHRFKEIATMMGFNTTLRM